MLVKIFVFDKDTKISKQGLDKNIVKYTNKQNAINSKVFASKKNYFLNIQEEFEKRGYLLLVKPSDKNKFDKYYENKNEFFKVQEKSNDLNSKIGLSPKKPGDYMIPLEKLLKVLLAFHAGGCEAFLKGNLVLKQTSKKYTDFSLQIDNLFTIDNMLNLYLLYIKAEEEKKAGDKRFPIPYYLLGFIGNYFIDKDFKELNDKLDILFSESESLIPIYDFFKLLTESYANLYNANNKVDYSVMVKREVDDVIFEQCYKIAIGFAKDKKMIESFVQS